MRILAIYRHYWPDVTPYARLLRAILEEATAQGHTATVYTAQPSYNDVRQSASPRQEVLNGVTVIRMPLLPERKQFLAGRLLNMSLFLAGGIAHAARHRKQYDLIIANTHPPIMMGGALRIIKTLTGIPYLLHAQDIHPESAELAGQLGSGAVTRFLRRIDIQNCRHACRVVTLSDDMKQTLLTRPGCASDENIEVINNFPLDRYSAADDLPNSFADSAERRFRVFFAGNMGHFQQLDRLIDVAHLLKDEEQIQFHFMGAGAARNALQSQAGSLLGRTVFFESHRPVEVAFACMQRADLGVVSLSPNVYRVAYPSKTMMYLSAGCPVLGLIESQSGLATTLRQHDLGIVPSTLAPEQIAESIRDAFQQRDRWTDEARNALRDRSETLFGRQQALNTWNELFATISKESGIAVPESRQAHENIQRAA